MNSQSDEAESLRPWRSEVAIQACMKCPTSKTARSQSDPVSHLISEFKPEHTSWLSFHRDKDVVWGLVQSFTVTVSGGFGLSLGLNVFHCRTYKTGPMVNDAGYSSYKGVYGPAALMYLFHTWFRPLIEAMTSRDTQLKTTLSPYLLSERVYLTLRNCFQVRHHFCLVFQVARAAADMSAGRDAAILLLSCCVHFVFVVPSCAGQGKFTWQLTLCTNPTSFNKLLI